MDSGRVSDIQLIKALAKPCGAFKIFFPSMEDEELKELAQYLMKKDRHLSDELRNYDIIWALIFQLFYGKEINLFYSIGDFQGVIGFLNILPSWKCSVMLKLWDSKVWKKSLVRDGIKLIDRLFNAFKLIRMETSSPDPRIVKIAKLVGFKEEGVKQKAFKWDGKLFDVTMLSQIRRS